MPYVTYLLTNTRVNADLRLTVEDAVAYQLNPTLDKYSRYSKNFCNSRTYFTDEVREAPEYAMNRLLRTLDEEYTKDYITFRIPKASGGTRTIEAPATSLKILQRDIADVILNELRVLPHDAAYAYTRGRCAYDALVTHQRNNAKWFLKIDIKEFFPSITKDVLLKLLPEVYPLNRIPSDKLMQLVDIATNSNDALPQGSPLSPVLSNLVMVGFDHALSTALHKLDNQRYTYTRYADDMLISCPYAFRFDDILQVIEELFTAHGLPFTINRQKLRYASMAGRNWNLGLMYNKDQQITVGNKKKKELHSLVNSFVVQYKNEEPWDISSTQELIGKLGYLKNVEPEYYETLIKKYENKYDLYIGVAFKHILNGTI